MEIKKNIQSQFLAALAMVDQAVDRCPDDLWNGQAYQNAVWQVAYHALFYTHLYLQPSADVFIPWAKARREYEQMEKRDDPYSKADIIEYLGFCREQVRLQVDALDLEGPSGFHWIPMDKLGLQFYNLRHLQHHVGELCERLGVTRNIEIDWIGQFEE